MIAKSGKFYSKIYILNQDNSRLFKWDISISDNEVKTGVVQTEANRKTLEKFRKVIDDMKYDKLLLFLIVTYFIYILMIFVTVVKNHKSSQLFFILIMAFSGYKMFDCFIDYNRLCRDAVYYFYLIK